MVTLLRLTWLLTGRIANTTSSQAQMEAMFALDFVSLLLSKHVPRQAETSMSAFLKQAVPLGSLNSEVVNPPPKPESTIQDTEAVSRGWRLQNFDAAANKLLKSASRLEAEVASETRYWSEVLAVKDKGWKMCRLPRERQSLGVQYGFLEGKTLRKMRRLHSLTCTATPTFRDRGLASLRRAEDGSLILDKGLVPSKARKMRVRVRTSNQINGCTKPAKYTSNEESIEGRILQARDTLYEEELFHELMREARVMNGQGVTTRQNLIRLAVSEEQEIMLDLVDVDQEASEASSDDVATEYSHEDDVLADAIAHSIRILLSYAHRQNLRRRTQPPPPLSQKRRHTPEYYLLRPVLAYLEHRSHVRWLESFLHDIDRVMESAGISCDCIAAPFASVNLQRKDLSLSKVEALVQAFLVPLESTFSGSLVTPQSSFQVRIRTNLSAPPFGTNYGISMNLPHNPGIQPPPRVGLRDEAAAIITHFMMLDVVSSISLRRPPLGEANGVSTWEAAYPHHGELLTVSPATGERAKTMKVSLARDEMTIQVHNNHVVDKASTRSQTWKSDPASPAQPSLTDFIADVSTD